tara:strand:+ start:78 stop:179 length:102 start_codon:yes stop_codon:yes gene_type:complete
MGPGVLPKAVEKQVVLVVKRDFEKLFCRKKGER